MKLRCNLTICASRDDNVVIRIEDDDSSVQFLSIEVPHADFVRAISGRYLSDLTCELRDLDLIGKKLETKIVELPIQMPCGSEFKDVAREAVKPYEIDGWKADEYDLKGYNGHRRTTTGYRFTFRRYVT